jgi:hypothetical protein
VAKFHALRLVKDIGLKQSDFQRKNLFFLLANLTVESKLENERNLNAAILFKSIWSFWQSNQSEFENFVKNVKFLDILNFVVCEMDLNRATRIGRNLHFQRNCHLEFEGFLGLILQQILQWENAKSLRILESILGFSSLFDDRIFWGNDEDFRVQWQPKPAVIIF